MNDWLITYGSWCPAGTTTIRQLLADIHPSVPLVCVHCGKEIR